MVNWKEIAKIDSHIHLMPEDVREANISYGNKFVVYGSVKDYIEIMKANNIEKAFIMPFNDPCMLSMDHRLESLHQKNLLDMVKGYKGLLYYFADIDLTRKISETLEEFDRVFQNESFIGIKVHPDNGAYPLDGAYYDEIFKYAEKNNILLEIHSYPRENLKDDLSSPIRIKRVLDKYPDLRMSIAHLGGFQYQELLGLDLYFNLSAILTDMTDRFGIEKTNRILKSFGPDRLVFASDFPDNRRLDGRDIYDSYFKILGQMDFSQEEAEKICFHNCQKMLERR